MLVLFRQRVDGDSTLEICGTGDIKRAADGLITGDGEGAINGCVFQRGGPCYGEGVVDGCGAIECCGTGDTKRAADGLITGDRGAINSRVFQRGGPCYGEGVVDGCGAISVAAPVTLGMPEMAWLPPIAELPETV